MTDRKPRPGPLSLDSLSGDDPGTITKAEWLRREGRARTGWRCRSCDATFAAWAAAEKHVDEEHGGGRLELVHVPPEAPDGDR